MVDDAIADGRAEIALPYEPPDDDAARAELAPLGPPIVAEKRTEPFTPLIPGIAGGATVGRDVIGGNAAGGAPLAAGHA